MLFRSEAEDGPYRQRRQDCEGRIPGLPTAGRPWLGCPRRDRLLGKPHRQAAALAQAGVIGWPVRHPVLLPWDVMAAVLVQLEWQDGHPEFGRVIPYVTRRLSTTAQSMHHANSRAP